MSTAVRPLLISISERSSSRGVIVYDPAGIVRPSTVNGNVVVNFIVSDICALTAAALTILRPAARRVVRTSVFMAELPGHPLLDFGADDETWTDSTFFAPADSL